MDNKFNIAFDYAGMIDLEGDPLNLYPEDDYSGFDDAEVDQYVEDEQFDRN